MKYSVKSSIKKVIRKLSKSSIKTHESDSRKWLRLREEYCAGNSSRLRRRYIERECARLSYQGVASIPLSVPIGKGLCLPHGLSGIFISIGAEIGDNCTIFQNVTIGTNATTGSKKLGAPVIGNNVIIGAGAVIIGGICIGNNVRIGANTTVTTDIPDNSTVISNYGTRIISCEENRDNSFHSFRELSPEQLSNVDAYKKNPFVMNRLGEQKKRIVVKQSNGEEIKISFIGDIMCEPLLIHACQKDGKYCFDPLFEGVKVALSESDYVIGNLETPLAGYEEGICSDLISFNAPDEFADALVNAGINMVSTANNHCLDRGISGLFRTMDVLDQKRIAYVGTSNGDEKGKDCSTKFFEINGIIFAVVCGTYDTNYAWNHQKIPLEDSACISLLRDQEAPPFYKTCQLPPKTRKNKYSLTVRVISKVLRIVGVRKWKIQQVYKVFHQGVSRAYPDNYIDNEVPSKYTEQILNNLRNAREKADIVFFFPHIGGQFNQKPGTFSEYMIKTAAKSGYCDAIIASHSHVIQKAEIINDIPCFFSIGNFSMSPNSYYIPQEADTDLGVIVHFYVKNKKISKTTFSVIYIQEKRGEVMKVETVDCLQKVDNRIKEKIEKAIATINRETDYHNVGFFREYPFHL